MIFSALFICKERESEWVNVSVCVCVNWTLFGAVFWKIDALWSHRIQNSMLTTLLVRNITRLYLITWDLNHQFYQVEIDRLVWTSEFQADKEFNLVNKREVSYWKWQSCQLMHTYLVYMGKRNSHESYFNLGNGKHNAKHLGPTAGVVKTILHAVL